MKQLLLTGSQLRQIREYLGISRVKMAKRMKISYIYLTKMEAGDRNVTAEMNRRFKDLLRLNNTQLLKILDEVEAEAAL
ncbi:helix-turn-helix domain-containing protein [Bacillus sp. AG4(2022)]|uniref:helix-turn-helix domain-containing protein n=1 Tax=Bacillus sp. AG4(2022) TaxID=2962594 RepID=UPI002880DBD2|nr:helix-turn-helix domain-containing protein [Bacillus sp. AG4(2022)]MDT0161859.1 helix-turn-helix domain-containing protein [Bacillus sp. AG4(2022)]